MLSRPCTKHYRYVNFYTLRLYVFHFFCNVQEPERNIPREALWKYDGKPPMILKVKFIDNGYKDVKYKGKSLTPNKILNLVSKHWSMGGIQYGEYVPLFHLADDDEDDRNVKITVAFNDCKY